MMSNYEGMVLGKFSFRPTISELVEMIEFARIWSRLPQDVYIKMGKDTFGTLKMPVSPSTSITIRSTMPVTGATHLD